MDINNFTQKSQQAILGARDGATRRHHTAVTPDHLVEALLGQGDTVIYPLLTKLGVNGSDIRTAVDRNLGRLAAVHGDVGDVAYGPEHHCHPRRRPA